MQFRTHTDPVIAIADPPWLEEARRWALILAALLIVTLIGIGLARGVAAEAGTSCTTRWDTGLQRYLTRCSDGRQFKSTYDKGFDRWQTRELPPWKLWNTPKR